MDGAGTGSFTSNLTQLDPSKRYYVRAYATNSAGTAYGNQVDFTTESTSGIIFNPSVTYSTVTDKEGNSYKTVQISIKKGSESNVGSEGDKDLSTWMAENLRSVPFNDGTAIPFVTSNTEWRNRNTPAFCWFLNTVAYRYTYGALYNWYVVDIASNGGKNICPTGWHVPTTGEWLALTEGLGGYLVAGGKLKETGTTHRTNPNVGATNSSGLTFLPGGFRDSNGTSDQMGSYGHWWTATASGDGADNFYLYYNYNQAMIFAGATGRRGYSIRCRKDY